MTELREGKIEGDGTRARARRGLHMGFGGTRRVPGCAAPCRDVAQLRDFSRAACDRLRRASLDRPDGRD